MRTISKNYVKMEKKLCPVCCTKHECGGILLHMQFREIPDDKTR